MCTPGAYVTERDFRGWETGLARAHAGELEQWGRADELSVTAAAIVALLSVFRGLRAGPDGCGVQMSLEGWAELLGRSRRMVCYAFDALAAAGLVWHRRRLIKREWVDVNGVKRKRADVWAVAYLSKKGAVRVARRGETKRLVVKGGSSARVLVAAGVVGRLLKTYAAEIRAIALRVTDALWRCTPSFGVQREKKNRAKDAGSAGAGFFQQATGPPSRSSSAAPPFAANGGTRGGDLNLTPAQEWPELWFGGDDRQRQWLIASFEPVRAERLRRFLEEATPADVRAQNARLAADVARLEAIERTQLTQAERMRREVLYAPHGRTPLGGRLGELRKQQAALRAAGELAPKRRRRRSTGG